MKVKLLLSALTAALLLALTSALVSAQEPVPPPYAGAKNPFPWTDSAALAAGKRAYDQSCAGCHGAGGGSLPTADFSKSDAGQQMQGKADYFFWLLSEGRLSKGMPPYKASLTEEQRWQIVTYMRSLTAPPAPATPPTQGTPAQGTAPVQAAAPKPEDTISLTFSPPAQARTGDTLTLTATLRDGAGKPMGSANVQFLMSADFFAKGLMSIGEATTNAQGVATTLFELRSAGKTDFVARYQKTEARGTTSIADSGGVFYQPEVGLHLPAAGPEVSIGPASSQQLSDGYEAPMTALRLPGGLLSWLLLFMAAMALVWGAYIVIMYQVWRISTVRGNRASNASLVPVLALIIVVGTGLLVILMIATGPYTHWQLPPH